MQVKRNGILICFICLLLFYFIVHSGAVIAPDSALFFPTDEPPYYDYWGYSREEYDDDMERYVESHIPNASDNDISPDRLEFLGVFDSYHMCVPMEKYCDQVYRGEKVAWKYEYVFQINRTATRIYKAVVEVRHYKMEKIEPTASLDALADSADMRLLDAAYHGEEQNIRLGTAMYHYDNEGNLSWIKWEACGRTFTLTVDTHWHIRDVFWGTWKDNMANYEDDEGIVADLLNPETAKSALWEFRARVVFGAVSDKVYIVIAICGGGTHSRCGCCDLPCYAQKGEKPAPFGH